MSTRIDSNTDIATALREAMSTVCTPVTVVTASVSDTPFGTTVSAFSSLSMDPPMVLVALSRQSDTLRAVTTSGHFGVNILGSEQACLAAQFATKGVDKFVDVPWNLSSGLPRIEGTSVWIACDVAELVDGGDHVIITGDVRRTESLVTAPLTYHRRQFGTHAQLSSKN
ncbi:flavin reductase family protein [Rhodococcoides kyotonense]|uniref:NADH-FMN oxidoreductase RutF, flavin reductase (DIM6/NTAB) family n=1 Tax=Rhodococcoides kyotonense TaxID=398843 RepID=A0A239HQG1_9NOCA|nr:flavin reductase family protein [Rhodococcus kyotonensis]SNS82524.1 NADH-FMN oxidoreductase RutF, flavin reductase (DIM6/NTAB) family [Rhodococcus kyotonensis]